MHRLVIMGTETRNNKGKKSSLLMCFKPVVAKDTSFKPSRRKDKTTNHVAAYIRVEEKNGVVSLESSPEYGGGSRRRENSKNRWQEMKAALNQTSLMKKINSKKKAKKDNLSRSNSSLENGTDGVEDSGKISKSQQTDSNISSSYGCSSAFTSSPSLTSSSSSHTDQSSGSLDSSNENETEVTKQKQYGVEDMRRKACYGSYISMCMFFIGLFVLITWGKFLATLYTTIWFYVMPPRPTRPFKERS